MVVSVSIPLFPAHEKIFGPADSSNTSRAVSFRRTCDLPAIRRDLGGLFSGLSSERVLTFLGHAVH